MQKDSTMMNFGYSTKPSSYAFATDPKEESKSVVPKNAKIINESTQKPNFKSFVCGFTSGGPWSSASRAILVSCIDCDEFEDEAVR